MMHLNHYPLTNYILDIIVERHHKIEFLKQAPNGEQISVDKISTLLQTYMAIRNKKGMIKTDIGTPIITYVQQKAT